MQQKLNLLTLLSVKGHESLSVHAADTDDGGLSNEQGPGFISTSPDRMSDILDHTM